MTKTSFRSAALASAAAIALLGTTVAVSYADSLTGTLSNTVKSATSTLNNVTSDVSGANGNSGSAGNGNSGSAGNGNTLGGITNTLGNVADTSNAGNGTNAGNGQTIGTFSDFINNLNAGNLTNSDFGKVSNVRIVDINDAFKNINTTALNDALSHNQTNLDALRNSLNGNSALNNALTGNNVDLSHVIGVDNTNNGSMIIYTDRNS